MFVKNAIVFVALVGFFFATSGCEHAPVKATEDSKRLQRIDAFVENLRVVYEGGNLPAFSSLYPHDRGEDLRSIAVFLNSTKTPHLDFVMDRIVLQDETIRVSLHWELRWDSEKSGTIKQRGNALFRLAGKTDLSLEAIEGDNPFTAPAAYQVPAP